MNNTREITLEYAEENYQLYPKFYLRNAGSEIHMGSFCVNKDGYIQLVREVLYDANNASIEDLDRFFNKFKDHCSYCIKMHKPVENIVDGVSGIKIWNEKIIDWNER